ncbi:hypothetical protein BpHYR1_006484 [Brachionus plicatilis]|uniref:Uncharacterized protein n=1 Tax=Brachionus plicatilis TaxID=10195 RepID=A0A3M7PIP2_BRAPC|nr:hypothetical protein BpHYR1_006484 [Brachionus plicatilis]
MGFQNQYNPLESYPTFLGVKLDQKLSYNQHLEKHRDDPQSPKVRHGRKKSQPAVPQIYPREKKGGHYSARDWRISDKSKKHNNKPFLGEN